MTPFTVRKLPRWAATAALGVTLGAAGFTGSAHAQFPPGFQPPPELPGAPPELARLMRQEFERSQAELRKFFGTAPAAPGMPFARPVVVPPADNRLGVVVERPDSALAQQLDLPLGQGLVVRQVLPESAAAQAGVQVNDVLLALNGKPVADEADAFAKTLTELPAEAAVELNVLRKGRPVALAAVKLAATVAQPVAVPEFAPPVGGRNFDEATSWNCVNGQFELKHSRNGVGYRVCGEMGDGPPRCRKVVVTEAGRAVEFAGLEQLPDAHRAAVLKLLEQVK